MGRLETKGVSLKVVRIQERVRGVLVGWGAVIILSITHHNKVQTRVAMP